VTFLLSLYALLTIVVGNVVVVGFAVWLLASGCGRVAAWVQDRRDGVEL
jgi:ABC-type uncharacterized transport system permease subunit